MDITTLALAKNYANKVAAGFSNVTVEGSKIIFTLNDGKKATVNIPAPKDGVSVVDLEIDDDGSLLCHMSDNTTIDAGLVPAVKGDPGFSPKAEVSQDGAVTTISITDEEKTTNATIDMSDYVSAKADGFNITWNGDTTGLTSSNPAQYYKVSDKILTVDDLVGASVSAVFKGEEETGIITEDGINERYNYILANSDASAGGTVISVYDLPAGGGGVNFYETGIYFTSLKATLGMDVYTSSLTKGNDSIQTIEGDKNFTGNITINNVKVATEKDLENISTSEAAKNIQDGTKTGALKSVGSTESSGLNSIALGLQNTASGNASVAMGSYNETTAPSAIALGSYNYVEGSTSVALGGNNSISGRYSVAEGLYTMADKDYSHAEGWNTWATGETQHVQGKWNITDANLAHIVGNGESGTFEDWDAGRSNIHTLDWDGNAWYQGDVYVGSTSGKNKDEGSVRLAKVTEIPSAPEYVEFLPNLYYHYNGNMIEASTGCTFTSQKGIATLTKCKKADGSYITKVDCSISLEGTLNELIGNKFLIDTWFSIGELPYYNTSTGTKIYDVKLTGLTKTASPSLQLFDGGDYSKYLYFCHLDGNDFVNYYADELKTGEFKLSCDITYYTTDVEA